MLPETNGDNSNLNAAFVTDNSLEDAAAGNEQREKSSEEENSEIAENTEDAPTKLAEINEVTQPETTIGKISTVSTDCIDEVEFDSKEERNKDREDESSSDDEEVGEIVEMSPAFESEWANLEEDLAKKEVESNDLNNDIDAYDAIPVNLSNDIAVNDIAAADTGLSINPDAEFIDSSRSADVLELEKLKISPSSYEDDSILPNDK